MKKQAVLLLVFFLLLQTNLSASDPAALLPPAPTSLPGDTQSLDVSDQNYLPTLIRLVISAQRSIDCSLGRIEVSDEKTDPVSLILRNLIDSAKRGVHVRLFLNTFTDPGFKEALFLREDKLKSMRKQGIEIHFVSPQYFLRDQLVVIDQEQVLEAGPFWTTEDFKQSLASATLTDSKELALKKKIRMELFPLWDIKVEKESRETGEFPVPLFLLQDIKYFSSMLTYEDDDAVKIYLSLLKDFYAQQQKRFQISLDDLGHVVPSDRTLDQGALLHQTYATVQRLEKNYGLLKIMKEDGNALDIMLNLPDQLGPTIQIPNLFLQENCAKGLTNKAIFSYLVILYKAQISGESPVWLGSERSVEQDFPLQKAHFRLGVDELRRANLIETFPFPLRQGTSYVGYDSLEYRYLINDIPTLSEKLATWERIRNEFGDENVKRARQMAELLGEPEDPKVVMAYLKLLTQYDFPAIQSFTQHISELQPRSTPSELGYLQELLQNETQGTQGLGTV